MVKYKEYKIEDVLTWQPQKEIDPIKINELSVDGERIFPFYGQSTVNNGIISYLCLKNDVLNNKYGKPTILIHSNNQNIVYLESPFYLKDGHGATSVLQSEHLNRRVALYIISSIKKVIKRKFSYNKKATKIALKNTLIQLPINTGNEIDYLYMENYINKLEKAHISNITSYLTKTGLDNKLTENEKLAIDRFSCGSVIFNEFKIIDIFFVNNTHSILSSWVTPNSGKNPYVTAGEGNNSISAYVSYENKKIEEGNSIMIGGKTLVITYQPIDYFSNDSHNLALYMKNQTWRNENVQLFMVSALYKSLKPLYSWGNSISKKKIQTNKVLLPVNNSGKIDYEFMDSLIRAYEKQAVNDFVNTIE